MTDPIDTGVELERRAGAAYMAGREGEYLELLGRAYRAHLDDGEPIAALRCAFWVGINLARRGKTGPASGWLGRARRLLESEGPERVERGYLLLPDAFEHEARGEWPQAAAVAGEAAAIGERFGDADLHALAGHERGQALIRAGDVAGGLALLDQAMVAAEAGELSPIVTGIVYCGVILACEQAHDMRRAREWTATLSRWCDEQPEMLAFTGRCLIHRAEIMQWRGAWEEALAEARRAAERCLEGENRWAAGEARYREGEIHRLRGESAAAESAYRAASRHGYEPQPGLALLRLAQGDLDSATSGIERLLAECTDPGERARLLPAQVEIALAGGRLETASAASEELDRLAGDFGSDALAAHAAHAQGAVWLERGDATSAFAALRRAAQGWSELDAPYETAKARALAARACAALGDEDAAQLELDAARAGFAELEAAPELSRLATPAGAAPGGLTGRELEVLRLVAAGHSNREIAAVLTISEHTVARHLQNIFAKLGVSSRTAAGAFAFEHDLA
ncbi:MAG TPA: helix-turn-helix transcriptional regulator [Solirubrobacterales bacterium]|nr:helix-turn-helix transcriptional regulator [Solirubrobacterales bacterium]